MSYDLKTGEIKFYGHVERSDVPFRSRTDLKSYNDDEVYEPDSSLTDTSQVLDIAETVSRMMRGEVPLPFNSLKESDFDIDLNKMSIDEAFEYEDITQSSGFDLADIPSVVNGLSNKSTSASEDTATNKQVSNEPVVDPVGQSITEEELSKNG